MKRIASLLLVLVLLFAAAAFAEESDKAYIEGKGNLVIGITEYAPMNYYDDAGELIGFDTEFAKVVCEKLGLTAEFVVIDWSTKEIELEARSIDCIWNGLTITDERKENMEFSVPYMENKQVVVIRSADAETYTSLESLASAALVAEEGSVGEEAILADEFLSTATYTPIYNQASCLMELKAGTADAAVLDVTLATAMVGEGTDYADLQMIEGIELSNESYGIAFRKGSDMAAAVDAVIAELLADGTLATIADTYGLGVILLG